MTRPGAHLRRTFPRSEEGAISIDAVPDLGSLSGAVRRLWVDQLVDLQVLAAHGDTGAAARAAHWLAHDVEAREVWDTIADACDRVRSAAAGR